MLVAAPILAALLRDPYLLDPVEAAAAGSDPGWQHRLPVFHSWLVRFERTVPSYLVWCLVATTCFQYAMYLHGLYDRQPVRRARNLLLRLVRSAAIAAVAVAVLFFVVRPPALGRTAIFGGYILAVLAIWTERIVIAWMVRPAPERVIIVGTGSVAEHAVAAARGVVPERHRVLGFVGPPDAQLLDLPRLGDWQDVARLLTEASPDRLLIVSRPPTGWDIDPLVAGRLAGVAIVSGREFAESVTGRVLESELGPEFIIDGTARPYGWVSRLGDILLSLTLLVLLAPLILAVAVAVRVGSGTPVLFRQRRVGRGGREFTQVKFRTMAVDAERDGPSWSPEGDPRITRLGRVLRRWRLDELPNLVNVLRGDMAFVGPRPEQPFFVEQLSQKLPGYTLRHLVRPGLTGWAQVRHAYGSSDEDAREKLRYDLFYVKHRSPSLDLAIAFDTVRVVLRGQGR